MPYFECAGCGQLAAIDDLERSTRREHCPVCDEETTWVPAFEVEEGVSF